MISNCIMAIAAHPDDVELGCSGTLMMEKSHGKQIVLVDLTRGELGTRGTPEIRSREAEAAMEIMGFDERINLKLPDGFFQNTPDYQREVISVIRRFKPAILITNAPADRHPDHGRAAQLVSDAAFLSGLRKIETLWNDELQEPWRPAQVYHFIQDRFLQPSFVYDISPVIEKKVQAIRAFSSQFDTAPDHEPQTYISTPAFLEGIIERAKMMGQMAGIPYAEGFITTKMQAIHSLDSFLHRVT